MCAELGRNEDTASYNISQDFMVHPCKARILKVNHSVDPKFEYEIIVG
jgi:hypothetical protein